MLRITMANFSTKLFVLLIGAALALAVTNAYAAQTAAEQSSSGNGDLQTLQQEWAEAVDALKSYSAAQRDQAVAQAEQTLAAMDERIEQLESRAEDEWSQLSENVRQQRQTALRALRRERNVSSHRPTAAVPARVSA